MNKIVFFSLCLIKINAVFAQKTIYDNNAQVRNVGSFTGVSVSNAVDLFLSMGSEDKVAISTKDAKDLEYVITEVKNGILYIRTNSYKKEKKNGRSGFIVINNYNEWGPKNVKAYVSIKNINTLSASGASDIHANGIIKSPKLDIHLSGASDFNGTVDIQTLSLKASGSSDFKISGKATDIKLDVSGASDVKGYNLVAENADLDVSGASDVKITVNKKLSAEASGVSKIYYKGNPQIVKEKSSGVSTIRSNN